MHCCQLHITFFRGGKNTSFLLGTLTPLMDVNRDQANISVADSDSSYMPVISIALWGNPQKIDVRVKDQKQLRTEKMERIFPVLTSTWDLCEI